LGLCVLGFASPWVCERLGLRALELARA